MKNSLQPHRPGSRRDFLAHAGGGFGALALAQLAAADPASGRNAVDPGSVAGKRLDPPRPHLRPRARSVIFLFMEGGPSHLDTFDPKPDLQRLAGKPIPESFGEVITAMGEFIPNNLKYR